MPMGLFQHASKMYIGGLTVLIISNTRSVIGKIVANGADKRGEQDWPVVNFHVIYNVHRCFHEVCVQIR